MSFPEWFLELGCFELILDFIPNIFFKFGVSVGIFIDINYFRVVNTAILFRTKVLLRFAFRIFTKHLFSKLFCFFCLITWDEVVLMIESVECPGILLIQLLEGEFIITIDCGHCEPSLVRKLLWRMHRDHFHFRILKRHNIKGIKGICLNRGWLKSLAGLDSFLFHDICQYIFRISSVKSRFFLLYFCLFVLNIHPLNLCLIMLLLFLLFFLFFDFWRKGGF